MKNELTRKRLKELLHYEPDTGIFTWKVSKANGKIKIGDVAGGLDNWGYHNITVDTNKYRTHRLVMLYMTGKFPKLVIDHINNIRDDNRYKNLRVVTCSENNKKTSINKNNSTGINGVSFNKANGKFSAQINIKGKQRHLGYYVKIEDAKYARLSAERQHGYYSDHENEPLPIYNRPVPKHKRTKIEPYNGTLENYPQERLKSLLNYNPETGIVTWKINTTNRVIGDEAGTLHKITGYRQIRLDNFQIKTHRLIFLYMTGKWPEKLVDHINGDKSDNRWVNLRKVSDSENGKNTKRRSNNKTGCTGVDITKNGKFRARIMDNNGKRLTLGTFDKLEDAISTRKDAEPKYGYHPNHDR